ncbi:MAG TPA: 1-deoxy-D-xylulose-5-phosphate synthase [bacterium]|nr:1-deoxy-D-xylulose-5-phosphate synthase [bacterium]HQG46688.1 1-deoxy-D-xylulose-5-phosphate synthase [bacterium]HQI48768.1 1-deoxy-D-xylulose-5-phosphate synthase [bacterium]HQJ66121.1 1-deoxy-D-xylulose-5-phosphate synthase [bacterium]
MDALLPHINSPQDIRRLDIPQLTQLAREIREYIIHTISETGGHLAPSLGVVELTLALHHVLDTPHDKIVWDVGHQAYAHKIITGRREAFSRVRQEGGISGFPKPSESLYDAFGVGHASTAISAAFGMACARDLAGDDNRVVAVIGDGALTGGLAYEGLNNAGASGKDILVIVNDNSMSISHNVGAMSKYLTNLISNPLYNRIKSEVWDFTGKFDRMGPRIRQTARRMEESLKGFIMPGVLFERLGFRYLGPIDGHNFAEMLHTLHEIQALKGPILLHVLTKKGRGYRPAEENAPVFHGLGKFDKITGEVIKSGNGPTYTEIFGRTLIELADGHPEMVGITAAMSLGTGMSRFAEKFPERFFDVGIAEGHALTFAAGMASQGFHPVVGIYSTFLQRAYDHLLHDIALQKLPVVLAIDRAGIVGDDGPTHHGVFDIAYLRTVPDLVIMAPKDEEELRQMLYTAMEYKAGPVAIRYPRGAGEGVALTSGYQPLEIGRSELLDAGEEIAILALGHLASKASSAARILREQDHLYVQVINTRFVKPLDLDMLEEVTAHFKALITLEEGTLAGGFGSAIAEYLADHHLEGVELYRYGLPDHFLLQGNRDRMLDQAGLSIPAIVAAVRSVHRGLEENKPGKIRNLFRFNKHAKSA